jgi:hypothetical protein
MDKHKKKMNLMAIFLILTITVGVVFVQDPLALRIIIDGGDPPPPPPPPPPFPLTVSVSHPPDVTLDYSNGIKSTTLRWTPTSNGAINSVKIYKDGVVVRYERSWTSGNQIAYTYTSQGTYNNVVFRCRVVAYHSSVGNRVAEDYATVRVSAGSEYTVSVSDQSDVTLDYSQGEISTLLSWTPTTTRVIDSIRIYQDDVVVRQETGWPRDTPITYPYISEGIYGDVRFRCFVLARDNLFSEGYKNVEDLATVRVSDGSEFTVSVSDQVDLTIDYSNGIKSTTLSWTPTTTRAIDSIRIYQGEDQDEVVVRQETGWTSGNPITHTYTSQGTYDDVKFRCSVLAYDNYFSEGYKNVEDLATVQVSAGSQFTVSTSDQSDVTLNYSQGQISTLLSWIPITNRAIDSIRIYQDEVVVRQETGWTSGTPITYPYNSSGTANDVVFMCLVLAYDDLFSEGYRSAEDYTTIYAVYDPDGDCDSDDLTNSEEANLGTSLLNYDTDGDGIGDGDEVNFYESDPNNPDDPSFEHYELSPINSLPSPWTSEFTQLSNLYANVQASPSFANDHSEKSLNIYDYSSQDAVKISKDFNLLDFDGQEAILSFTLALNSMGDGDRFSISFDDCFNLFVLDNELYYIQTELISPNPPIFQNEYIKICDLELLELYEISIIFHYDDKSCDIIVDQNYKQTGLNSYQNKALDLGTLTIETTAESDEVDIYFDNIECSLITIELAEVKENIIVPIVIGYLFGPPIECGKDSSVSFKYSKTTTNVVEYSVTIPGEISYSRSLSLKVEIGTQGTANVGEEVIISIHIEGCSELYRYNLVGSSISHNLGLTFTPYSVDYINSHARTPDGFMAEHTISEEDFNKYVRPDVDSAIEWMQPSSTEGGLDPHGPFFKTSIETTEKLSRKIKLPIDFLIGKLEFSFEYSTCYSIGDEYETDFSIGDMDDATKIFWCQPYKIQGATVYEEYYYLEGWSTPI